MMELLPGANTALTSAQCVWTLECSAPSALGDYAAVALLPVNDKRQPKGESALFQVAQPWMSWVNSPNKISSTLNLSQLPAGADRVLLIVYVFSAAGPISTLQALHLRVEPQIEFKLKVSDYGESALILGEFYYRTAQWKFRALAEGSAYGLAAFGRRIGLNLDEAHPNRLAKAPEDIQADSLASGTGFAVSPSHILTCAHVIEGMREVQILSFEGRHRAEPVVVDRRNDLALLRIQGAPPLKPVTFPEGKECDLGDAIIALGFPLAGLTGGGVQVTQGGVSALFGLQNDSSLLQFTAPIQPGSSGSPLFDCSGRVIGMVTSCVPDAQNMNFALKARLALAFLDACGLAPLRSSAHQSLTTAQIIREAQQTLWRIEAQNPHI